MQVALIGMTKFVVNTKKPFWTRMALMALCLRLRPCLHRDDPCIQWHNKICGLNVPFITPAFSGTRKMCWSNQGRRVETLKRWPHGSTCACANRRASRITAKKNQKYKSSVPPTCLAYILLRFQLFLRICINTDLYHNLSCKWHADVYQNAKGKLRFWRNRCHVNVAFKLLANCSSELI